MRLPVLLLVAGMLLPPVSRADEPTLEETVRRVLTTDPSVLPEGDRREAWNRVERHPERYLPFMRERLSPERIEGAANFNSVFTTQREISLAITLLSRLGGRTERVAMLPLLEEAGRRRDALTPRAEALALSKAPPSLTLNNQIRWYSILEMQILDAFAEARDASLRDLVLSRLEGDTRVQERSISYLRITCHGDPLVRARLKRLLETAGSSSFRAQLVQFFEYKSPSR